MERPACCLRRENSVARRALTGFSMAAAGNFIVILTLGSLDSNRDRWILCPRQLIAYKAAAGILDFVVADRGVGVLNTLRDVKVYATLLDAGRALELALTDGVSRYGPASSHGHGFRPIFVGLANLPAELRFRSAEQSRAAMQAVRSATNFTTTTTGSSSTSTRKATSPRISTTRSATRPP